MVSLLLYQFLRLFGLSGCFFFPFAMIVIVGSANAVNLTMDLWIAIMPVIIAGASFVIISYIVGRQIIRRT